MHTNTHIDLHSRLRTPTGVPLHTFSQRARFPVLFEPQMQMAISLPWKKHICQYQKRRRGRGSAEQKPKTMTPITRPLCFVIGTYLVRSCSILLLNYKWRAHRIEPFLVLRHESVYFAEHHGHIGGMVLLSVRHFSLRIFSTLFSPSQWSLFVYIFLS